MGSGASESAETPEQTALRYLQRFSGAHGLRPEDLSTAELRFARTLPGGAHLVRYGQRVQGFEVYPSATTILMRRDYQLVAISGNLERTLLGTERAHFALSPSEAIAPALAEHFQVEVWASDLIDTRAETGPWQKYSISEAAPLHFSQPLHAKPILYADGRALVPAYFVEFMASPKDGGESEAYRYILAAKDGRVFQKRNLTAADGFSYRVWAEASGEKRPFEGPHADFFPHPTGVPDGSFPALIAPNLVEIEGFNTNPFGQVDPWLDVEAVETRGNNVDAYSDYNDPDGYTNGDIRATVTSANAFDRLYDLNGGPLDSESQTMASVTELFYVTNWLHDYWYDSGFDELAGNAQVDNFGRGGVAGDPLHAEAQDSYPLRRDNANMSTPSDGMSPRMQMYEWTGVETRQLTFTPGGSVASGTGSFGPLDFDVTGDVRLAGGDNLGCGALGAMTGRIVLIDRGVCAFTVKAGNAQAAGAIGVIIANNRAGDPPLMGGTDASIVIPVLSITQDDGNAVKAALMTGAVSAQMFRNVGPDLDGALDNSIVAHEWGHYLHHRLHDCGTHTCSAMSEGWADFNALHMALREGDSLSGVFPTAIFANQSFAEAYFGIRRFPYSTDFSKNGLTFGHMADGAVLPSGPINDFGIENSESHNAGEVWASMLFEVYTALQADAASSTTGANFQQVQRNMANYVVAGLQMAPRDATHMETRDALLAAISAINADDMAIASASFARRGAGSCAVSPDRLSETFAGITESFELRPNVTIGAVTIDDSVRSCDGDGLLDGDERGRLVIGIGNPSPLPLAGTTLTVSSTAAGVTFPNGASLALPMIGPWGFINVELELALPRTLADIDRLELPIVVQNAGACATTLTSTVVTRVNFDETPGATIDDVEAAGTPWALTGLEADSIWTREELAPLEHAWYGVDFGGTSDTRLESPSLEVGTAGSLVIDFDHRYSFETSDDGDEVTYWDGGVIEISEDDGQTWTDISTYVDPGYGGALTDISGNPLALRSAFVATSSTWPMPHHVSLDLGAALAGRTVKIRFRIGTDQSAGDFGWEIDNISVTGITNAPFYRLLADGTVCAIPLIADAGTDQTSEGGQVVVLDGSRSISSQNLPLTYAWSQVSGPNVTLLGAGPSTVVFTSPSQETASSLRFMLTVGDGTRTATDTVDVSVRAIPVPTLLAAAGDDRTVNAHDLVVLDASSSRSSAGLPLSYTWTQISGPMVTLTNGNAAIARFEAPEFESLTALEFEVEVSDGARSATDTVEIRVRSTMPTMVIANAGGDQTVNPGATVVLDASASRSTYNLALTYSWAQVAGPAVQLENADNVVAVFTAPGPETTVSFEVTVSDGTRVATDTVEVVTRAAILRSVDANAGLDAMGRPGEVVVLDGTKSMTDSGQPLSFRWTQKAGPTVQLTNPTGAVTTFISPAVNEVTTLTFELEVASVGITDVDSVNVSAQPAEVMPVDDGSCSCNTSAPRAGSSSGALMMFGLLALLARRRR